MDQSSRSSDESLEESRKTLLAEYSPPSEHKTCRGCKSRRTFQYSVIIPWLISLTLFVWLVIQGRTTRFESCVSDGFWRSHELEPARKEIPAMLKQVRFTAGLEFNESGQLHRPVDPTRTAYVGTPTAEMDAAWHELDSTVDIFLTAEEAQAMGGDMSLDPESGLYMAEISVFHDLHCLNMIRKSRHLDYYPKLRSPTLQSHIEHCIDSLRQSLMCFGDMTFIPERWSDNRGAMMPDFENLHTCRDFDALRRWARGRDAADPELWPKNAERLRLADKTHR